METVIKGHTYSIGKMDVFQQFHVARRLAPLLYATSSALLARLRTGETTDANDLTAVVQAVEPLVQVISSMPDADSQYVLNACLNVCQRKSGTGGGTGFQRVLVDGNQLMFQDIDLLTTMQLVAAAIKVNLGNFLDALPDPSADEKRPA